MDIDKLLLALAPLTPALLPIIVIIWYRTRQELQGIRAELKEIKERPVLSDPRLGYLTTAIANLTDEMRRIAESERQTVQLLTDGPLAGSRQQLPLVSTGA
jgi:signal transduction histidine kinase